MREDFPILEKDIIYFDSACMALKPQQVVQAMEKYYTEFPACHGRSGHSMANALGTELTKARKSIQSFVGAKSPKEIIFTRNTTEGVNLLANAFGFVEGNEVIISDKEHNSNLLPWLKSPATVKISPSKKDNTFDLEAFDRLFTQYTKLVSVVHTSNLDGVTNPVKEICKITHEHDALLHLDAAQSIPHHEVDLTTCDFMSFSGHKMCGPTGTGIFYGKKKLLEQLNQFLIGGETVQDSTYEKYVKEELPMRFEAGLQDYAGMLGLAEACRYLQKIGMKSIGKQELKLNSIITEGLGRKVDIIGPRAADQRAGIFSFNVGKMDPHHVAGMLDASKKILVRSGAHCCHSWFNKHEMKGSVRASMYFYNTEEEAQLFVDEVKKIVKLS